MIFKTWLTSLNDVQKAISSISTLSTTANGATHMFSDSAVVVQYANALKGLNKEQALLALSYKNLSVQQKEQILSQMGLIASENTIQSELLQTTLTQKGVSAEKTKAILVELGLMNAENGELFTQKACNQADLEAILIQKGVVGVQKEAILTTLGLAGAETTAATATEVFTLATRSLGTSIGSLAKAHPILIAVAAAGLLIYGAVKAYDAFTISAEEAAEAMKEAQQKIDEARNNLKTTSDTLSENKERFLELSQGVSQFSENLRLSEKDYAEYLSISNKLAELFPELVSGYDEQGNALLAIGKNADETNEKLQDMLETQQNIAKQTLIDNMNDVAIGVYSEVEKTKNSIDGIKAELESLEKQYEGVNVDIVNSDGLISLDDSNYSKYGKTLEDALTSAGVKFEKNVADSLGNSAIQLISASPEQLEQAQNFYDGWLATEKEYFYASQNGLKRDIEEKERTIKSSYSKMSANIQAWMQDNYNYQYLSDSSAKLADALVPEINWDELEDPPAKAWDYQNYVETNILKPLMGVPKEHRQEIDEMFEKLLSFENGDLDVLKFADDLQAELKKFNIDIDVTPIIADEQEAKKMLQNSIDAIAEGGSADFFTSSGLRVDANEYKTLQEYTKNFNVEQIELWESVTLGITSATEAINKYEEAIKTVSNALTLDDAKLKVVGDEENDIIGLTGEYELLQEVLSDTKDVSIETYEKLTSVSEDYSRALKIEAGRIVVDNQKLKMVNKTRTESIKKEIKEASTLKKLEWINNAKKLQRYNFQQNDLNAYIWETCDALQQEISQFDILVQGIDAASNAFTAFQEAQDAAQSGDYFDVGLEMADAFQKGLETGKVGTPEFIAAMQGAMDEDLFTEIINMDDAKAQFDAVRKFYEDVYSQYFIEGEDAEYDISGLDNFAKKVASIKDELGNAKYATYDKAGNFAFLESVNIEELAKELKLNAEIVYAILGEMEEYSIGDSFKFEDENFINEQYNKLNAVTDAQKLYNDALENGSKNQQIFAKQMLDTANAEYEEWLQGLGDKILGLEQQWQEQGESNQSFGEYLKNNYSNDEIITMYSTATERAEELRQKMHELEVSGRKGSTEWKNYNAELEKLDDAISAIDNTTEKQELLNEAVQFTKERYERLQEIMESLKDPDLDGESMEKLKQEAYELIAALGQLPKSVEIEFKAKVAELEEKVKTVEEKKAALEKTEVAGYKYSPAYQAQMGEYNAQIRDYNQEIQEINAILHLDVEEARSKIEEMKAEDVDKEGTVTYSPNFDACKRETPPPLVGVVNYEGNFSNIEPPSGGGKTSGGGKQYNANGTPKSEGQFANGTFNAFATGSQVSIPKNEKALVNELGEEGLVRNGKLIPIKGGAQLIDLKKGDIIFNH